MKKFIVGFALVMAAMSSQASYLYWQITSTEQTSFSNGTFNGHEIAGFRMTAVNNDTGASTVLNSYAYNPGTSSHAVITASGSPDSTGGAYVGENTAYNVSLAADITNYQSGYSYYIEVVGYDSSVYTTGDHSGTIGISEAYATSVGAITTDLQSVMVMPTAWTGGTYAAPEPTSGLLLLVGASLLALKRRKV